MKKLFLLALLQLLFLSGFGQALSTYTFSAFSNTYTPVSGSFLSPSVGSSWGTSTWDDCAYNGISIGFNFVYCGTTYTTCAASQNCWIVLGQNFPTSFCTTYTCDLANSMSTNMPRPILAALWTDTKTSGACVRYATTGTSPNRVFTIEWSNMGFYSTSGSWSTPSESVEIILYETSNIIDFAYTYHSSHSYSTSSCSIGITGGSGSYPTTGTQQYWSLNNAGSSPTPSMTTNTRNISGQPATNQVYRWAPDCPVLAPTNDGPVCTGSSVNLNGLVTSSASTITGYSWTGPGGFTSTLQDATVSGATMASAGVYTFTATTSSCTVSATTTLAVDSTPTASIAGATSFCSGNSSNITITGTAGATVDYRINSGGILSTVLDASGRSVISTGTLTTGTTAAVYTYSLVQATLGSCSQGLSGSVNVIVNPMPASLIGTTAVCQGLTTTLSESDAGGIWTSGSVSVATVTNTGTSAVVTGVSAGTANISYTFATGCGVYTTVTVNPLPSTIVGPSAVCYGSAIALSNATSLGTWSSSNTSVASIDGSGNVTGTGSGTATITYTLGTGCIATKSITVNSLPAAISGSTAVCEASTTTVTSTTTGGTWFSGSPGIATISATGVVSGVSAGTSIISYVIGTGCYQTMTMIVNPLPVAITGASSVCAGSSVTLTNGSGSGDWTTANATIATAGTATGVITGVTPGTVNITFTLPTTCYITTSLIVNPVPPTITGASSVCEGGSTIALANALSGGSWSTSDATKATVGMITGIVTGVAAGSVDISYNRLGCAISKNIVVLAQPGAVISALGDTMMCPGDFVVLAANYGSGYTYQWSSWGSPLSGATNDYYVATAGANYSVSVLNTLGCTSISRPTSVTINPSTATVATTDPTNICAGSSAAINANTGAGLTYQWVNGATAISGATGATYHATASGTYNVIVSNAAGCAATSAPGVSVTIVPAPSTTLWASGPLNFCTGDSVRLQADTSSGLSYEWHNGGVPIAGATNQLFTAHTPGTYEAFVTNSHPCTSIAAAVVTTIPLPSANITTPTAAAFCTGGSALLRAVYSSGNTYQWYLNGSLVPGAVSDAYTARNGGNYKVHVTSAAGCENITSPAFFANEVNAAIARAASSPVFCWGGSSLLQVNVTSSPGVTFQWLKNGAPITGATDNTYLATTTDTFSCVVAVAGSCTLTSNFVNTTRLALPNPHVYFDGYVLSTELNYSNYQWYRNLALIAVSGPSFMPTDTGDYSVKVIDSNGCQSVSNVYHISRIGSTRTTGFSGPLASGVSLFPNPAHDMIHIVAPIKVNAMVSAADGRRLVQIENANQIDLSALADGVYLVTLTDTDGHVLMTERVTKQ